MADLTAKKRLYQDFLESASSGDYQEKIKRMIEKDRVRLLVNVNDLRSYNDGALAKSLLENPVDEITAFHMALKDSVDLVDAAYGKRKHSAFFVGFEGSFGAHHVTPRGLSARLLSKLVCVEGIVSKCSLVHPKVVKSVHYCPTTELTTERVYRDATSLDGLPSYGVYPKEDDAGNPLVTEFGLSLYKNHQDLSIQEMPERAPTGQLPRSVDIILDDDLVDAAKPGDRVQIAGIYRALPGKRQGGTSGVFRTVLLANSVRILSKESLMPPLTDIDIRNINKIARSTRVPAFSLLSRSLAPSIYGHQHVKEGILCLLLGGVEHNLKRGGHIRGDINILMVGDPSCGKSQLLRFVQNTAAHCITTTGRGASGVGLTAAVTTDRETGERRLEAGAMVLGDGGIVCVDEFDKMSDLDRVSLHEVMEQQTVTIAKAGIHTSLNARCSVLAAANPVYGQYDPYQAPMANIGLPDSLLSRFDLLFIVLDKMDPEIDTQLSLHVLQSHMYRRPGEADGAALRLESSSDVIVAEHEETQTGETPVYVTINTARGRERILSIEFVKKYLLYAKARFHPSLTPEAGAYIANAYASLRAKEGESKTLPVTARTLETMIRLATAHAKARLSDLVSQEDAEAAMGLINFAYYNEARPLPKPTKTGRDDSSGDEDGGDGGEGGARATPSSAQPTPRKEGEKEGEARMEEDEKGRTRSRRKAQEMEGRKDEGEKDEGREEEAEGSSGKASGGLPRKAPAKTKEAYDPFDFSAPPPAKRTREETKEAEQKGAGEEQQEEGGEEGEEAAVPVTPSQLNEYRQRVLAAFKASRQTSLPMTTLVAETNKDKKFTRPQVDTMLARMSQANEIMVAKREGLVLLI